VVVSPLLGTILFPLASDSADPPLEALMQNRKCILAHLGCGITGLEIENLRKKGIEVVSLSSQVPREEQEEVILSQVRFSFPIEFIKISRHLQLYDIRLKLLYGNMMCPSIVPLLTLFWVSYTRKVMHFRIPGAVRCRV
jgi:hypothetical protein